MFRPAGLLQIARCITGGRGITGTAAAPSTVSTAILSQRWCSSTKRSSSDNAANADSAPPLADAEKDAPRGVGHVVVVGGNGHLGSAICEAAVQQGFEVKSLSRRGVPPTTGAGGWASQVEWIQADALEPDTYRHLLEGAAGVIHTVGTLMENDVYKKALRRGQSAEYHGANYELINRDTAVRVAETATEAGVGAMLFFSADGWRLVSIYALAFALTLMMASCIQNSFSFRHPKAASVPPGVDPRYLSTKREAERVVLALEPPTRGLVFRPGFMYSEHEPATMAIGTALLGAGTAVKMLKLGPLARAVTGMAGIELDTLRPLRTVDVAAAAVAVLQDSAYAGIFEIHAIKRIAEANRN